MHYLHIPLQTHKHLFSTCHWVVIRVLHWPSSVEYRLIKEKRRTLWPSRVTQRLILNITKNWNYYTNVQSTFQFCGFDPYTYTSFNLFFTWSVTYDTSMIPHTYDSHMTTRLLYERGNICVETVYLFDSFLLWLKQSFEIFLNFKPNFYIQSLCLGAWW